MSNQYFPAPAALMFLLACGLVMTAGAGAASLPDPVTGQDATATTTGGTGPAKPAAAAVEAVNVPVPAADAVAPPANAKPASRRKPPRRSTPVAPGPSSRATAARPIASNAVTTGRITGKLELAAGPNQPVDAGEVAQSVVYYLPKAGGGRPQPARFSVDTQSKGFNPSLLVVPLGSTVSFPNRDQILHNVFSRTPGTTFDLGYFGPGETRETRFNKPGLVVVNCSVHNSMRSNVLVLATPYFARPGRDGRFSLGGLPPGPGTLVFWHPRANAQSLAVDGPVSTPVLRRLVATRAPLDAHRR